MSDLNYDNGYTFSVWFYPVKPTIVHEHGDTDYFIAIQNATNLAGRHIEFYSNPDTYRYEAKLEGQIFGTITYSTIAQQWQHWVITVNSFSGEINSYTNGVLNGTINTSVYHKPKSFTINYPSQSRKVQNTTYHGGFRVINNLYDEIRIIDKELSATEVLELYNLD